MKRRDKNVGSDWLLLRVKDTNRLVSEYRTNKKIFFFCFAKE